MILITHAGMEASVPLFAPSLSLTGRTVGVLQNLPLHDIVQKLAGLRWSPQHRAEPSRPPRLNAVVQNVTCLEVSWLRRLVKSPGSATWCNFLVASHFSR